MKKETLWVIAIATTLSIILSMVPLSAITTAAAEPEDEDIVESEEIIPEATVSYDMVELIRTEPASLEEVDIALAATTDRITTAAALYESFLTLGYSEDHPGVQLALGELARAKSDYDYYEQCAEQIKWKARYEEYPIATQVWKYMSQTLGWSDEVCAGVMGNMMAECGGQTLNLKWNVYNSAGFYGLCQWHPNYYSQMQGASLETQLEFLGTSTKAVFNGWAGNVFDCNYEEFLASKDCVTAAHLFCIVYERPGGRQTQREINAQVAYNYFTK